jgi:hypothetical protein
LKEGNSSKVLPPAAKNMLVDISNQEKPVVNRKKTTSKKKTNKAASMTTINDAKFVRKNFKVKSNIASLTKKYANFLFANYNLDKDKDFFSK